MKLDTSSACALSLGALTCLALGPTAGCGDDADAGPSEAALTCEQYATSVCERLFRCVTDAADRPTISGGNASAVACAAAFTRTYCDRIDEDVAAGFVGVSAGAAVACTGELDTSACGSVASEATRFLQAGRLEGCPDAISGEVDPGGACQASWHCEEPASNCVAEPAGLTCTAPLSGDLYEQECVATSSGAAACAGRVCIGLATNQQAKTGICSANCQSKLDCGDGAVCVEAPGLGELCFSVCATDADCGDGFVCVDDVYEEGSGKACLVRAGQ